MLFALIVFAGTVALLIYLLNIFINGNDDYWPNRGVPFVHGRELGSFWDRITFKIPFHEVDNLCYKSIKAADPKAKMGGIMEFRRPLPFLVHPNLIKHVMVKDFDSFTNRRLFGAKNDPTLFDKMLFSIDNPEWKYLRATLSPTFTTGKIKRMFSVFTESSHKMATFLREEIKKSPELDFRDVMGRYSMDVIASAAFGVDSQNFKDKNSRFAEMGVRIQKQFTGYFALLKILLSMNFPSIYALFPSFSVLEKSAFEFFKDVIQRTIKHRDTTGEKRNDFLQLLMDTRGGSSDAATEDVDAAETQQQKAVRMVLTDELIVAQCQQFFLAGFDTVESMLIFAAYEMAINHDVQKKLREELKTIVDNKGEFSYETVNELDYLDMIISETLRKYPPVVRNERVCTEDFVVPDTNVTIKKGQIIVVPVWPIHHDTAYYPEPEKFVPERFSKENKVQRNPYTYMPFGVGPRSCIAMRFALTEGKAALAYLVHNFILEPGAKTEIPVKHSTDGNMKPAHGMWLKVTPNK